MHHDTSVTRLNFFQVTLRTTSLLRATLKGQRLDAQGPTVQTPSYRAFSALVHRTMSVSVTGRAGERKKLWVIRGRLNSQRRIRVQNLRRRVQLTMHGMAKRGTMRMFALP